MGEDATGIPTINKKQLMSLILLEQHGECRRDNISALDGQKKKKHNNNASRYRLFLVYFKKNKDFMSLEFQWKKS